MGIKLGSAPEISFVDQTYEKRREKLRYEYMHNAEMHKAIKLLAFDIKNEIRGKVPILPEFRNLNVIIHFLTDGFLAYEQVWEEYDNKFIELDVVTLEPEIKNGEKIWIQWRNELKQREIPNRNIIYIMYNALEMLFAQSLYTKLIDYNDIEFIKQHTKEIVSKLCK